MSYEIVKSIALRQNERGFWYAIITSACNNVRPHYYSKWKYITDKDLTKEELQKSILLNFYYGNFHGGKNTRYGKFLQFLGGSWGCKNENSRACKIYHFYDKLREKLRNDYLKNDSTTGCWEFGTPLYEKYCIRDCNLRNRQDRELKNALYKEFLEFKPNCKPIIVRLWQNNTPITYIKQHKNQRKGAYFTTDFEYATRFTSNVKLAYIKNLAEQNGYKVEFIEV